MQKSKASLLTLAFRLQVILIYLSVLVITPRNNYLFNIIAITGVLACLGYLIWKKNPRSKIRELFTRKFFKKQPRKARLFYTQNQKISLLSLSSICSFFITCVVIKFWHSASATMIGTLSVVTLLSMYFSLYYLISHLDEKYKLIIKFSTNVLKFSWILISTYCYFLARSIMMEASDIPYEQTVNKVSVLGYAALLYSLMFSALFVFITLPLMSLNLKEKRLRFGRRLLPKQHAPTIFLTCFSIGYIVFIAYTVNTNIVMKYVFHRTMPLDSRTTFYCNKQYMVIPGRPGALFITVGPGDYRMAIPQNYEYAFSRLKCTDAPPYYMLVAVKSAEDLKKESLLSKGEAFQNDIKAAVKG